MLTDDLRMLSFATRGKAISDGSIRQNRRAVELKPIAVTSFAGCKHDLWLLRPVNKACKGVRPADQQELP